MREWELRLTTNEMLYVAQTVAEKVAELSSTLERLAPNQHLRRGHAQAQLDSLQPVHKTLQAFSKEHVDDIVNKLGGSQ